MVVACLAVLWQGRFADVQTLALAFVDVPFTGHVEVCTQRVVWTLTPAVLWLYFKTSDKL